MIETFVEPMFQENAYVAWCDGAPECWIIDPGFPPTPDRMARFIESRSLAPQMILLTHCHPDHIAGVRPLRAKLRDVPIVAPRDEAEMLTDPVANLSSMMDFPVTALPADRLLCPGDSLALGELQWTVLDVAGHSPGGLAFYCAQASAVISGDALFAGSIGRYDFPGSSRRRLLDNIRNNLLTLPGETTLYSGHGPASTIGHEKRHNPVLLMELGE
jgi:glyoxylase-like metal-dependent hydrolase (beta-lactamase superfamily II)